MLKKRILLVLLCLCMVVGMLPAFTITTAHASTNGHTQTEAVQWAIARADEHWEINDGSGWTQCTEFIWAYYWYLLDRNVRGNACDYLTDTYGACPSGWTRPNKSTVQPGDIVIWDKYASFNESRLGNAGENGHIGIVVSVNGNSMTTAEANAYGSTRGAVMYQYDREVSFISGIIRPDWPQSPPILNIGDDFYAHIKSELGSINLASYNNNVSTASANSNDPRQMWHFIRQDNTYLITNVFDGCCMDVQDVSFVSGNNIQTYPFHSTDAQKWKIISIGRDTEDIYEIAPVVDNLRLDIADGSSDPGANVQLYNSNGTNAQRMKIQKITNISYSLSSTALPVDSYMRISFNEKYQGKTYLQVTGSVIQSGTDQAMNVATTRTLSADPRQIWRFIYQNDGSYKIVNEYSGWCLDADGGIATDDQNIWTWYDDNGTYAQRWYPTQTSGGIYHLISKLLYPWTIDGHHEMYALGLDIFHWDTLKETNAAIWRQADNAAQNFSLNSVNYIRPSRPAAPTNVQLTTVDDRTYVTWDAVPTINAYDSRQYDVMVFDSNNNAVLRGSTADNSFKSDQAIRPGHYEVYVRSVNSKYPSFAANYASVYTHAPADVVLTYSVDLHVGEGGKVTGGGMYKENEIVTVSATPNNGYRFVAWMENGVEVSTNATFSFIAEENRSMTAVFAIETPLPDKTYTVQVNAEPSEGGIVTGGGTYEPGTVVTIMAMPKPGYRFVGWKISYPNENDR